jgi:hypothetical protein
VLTNSVGKGLGAVLHVDLKTKRHKNRGTSTITIKHSTLCVYLYMCYVYICTSCICVNICANENICTCK